MSTVVMSRITTQFRDLLLCDEILLRILCRVLERKTIDGATSSRALQTVAKDPVFELVEGKLLTFPLSTVSDHWDNCLGYHHLDCRHDHDRDHGCCCHDHRLDCCHGLQH